MLLRVVLFLGALHAGQAGAQTVVALTERLDFERPESWAMAYATSATLLHGFAPRRLDTWQVRLGAEISNIPEIDPADTRVGFDGTKLEDLNKSPLFGRGRLWIGLPAGVIAELAYTPEVSIDGVRADGIYAAAVGRHLWRGDHWLTNIRVYAQDGRAHGDITCPRETAALGVDDLERNPFGCRAASNDEVELDYYGIELAAARDLPESRWRPYVAWSASRLQPEVHVNAQVFDVIDRTRLVTEGTVHTLTAGASYISPGDWELSLAATYTPLDVRRPGTGRAQGDSFWSLRLMVRLGMEFFSSGADR